MRSLIIHNASSGFGSSAIFEFERELVRAGDECVLRSLGTDQPAEDALRDADDFDLVVASGGDGTVTNILYALRGSGIKTCVFPSGTANLLFANLGNAPEPKAIAEACLERTTAPLDLSELSWQSADGTSHTRGFGIMSGIGFDALIMADADANKEAMGEAAYFAAAFNNLRPQVSTFTIDIDGERIEREGISCIVANTAMIQGDIQLIPGCTMDDGLLDVLVLETTDAVGLLVPILAGIIDPEGSVLGRPKLEAFRGASVRVSSSVPLPIELDGEVIEGHVSGYEARCLPGANRLVVDGHSPYYSA